MSPSKPPRILKLTVPKHNSDKLNAATAAAVRECARVEGKRFHGNGPKALATNAVKAGSVVSIYIIPKLLSYSSGI